MEDMPQDPFMLLSWVNMKLRDYYSSPEEMAEDLNLDLPAITAKLHEAGFDYLPAANQFR